MQLRELTEKKILDSSPELVEALTNKDQSPIKDLASMVLKLAAEAICFHCRPEHKGPPERSGFSYYHKYSEQSVAQCKASIIWEAPIMQIKREEQK